MMKRSIITYEHGKLRNCKNQICDNCSSCAKESENLCNDEHFEEIKKYCTLENKDCGLDYISKENCISINKYTGILQLNDGTYLEILPKISKNSSIDESRKIFRNLIYASHNLTKEYKHATQTQVQIDKNNEILEIFISVFCKDLKEILKRGIKKSYIRKENNLNVYKGKLKFSKHIKQNIVSQEKFYVEYSEFCMDIPENRIIKSACLYLLKQTTDDNNKKALRKMLVEFDDVEICLNLDKDLQEKQINRLHQYYERPLQYAEFFLRKQSFNPRQGKTKLPALLFPLNKMFEDYIENILRNNNVNCRIQYSPYYLAKYNDKNLFNTQMDFVIFKDNKALVLDAKWKLINQSVEKMDIDQADLYQLFTYSEIIKNKNNIDNVSIALLYPKTDEFKDVIEWKYFNETAIRIIPIDILNQNNNNFLLKYCNAGD